MQVGWDVVCRIGDPTDPHCLLRAGAQRATCILSMVSADDKQEEENTNGVISGGASLSTLLALRHVNIKYNRKDWDNFRCRGMG